MNYVEFNVKDKTYKLRLNTRNTISLEKSLGCNPISIFGTGDKVPTVTVMIKIFHAALQAYHHGITLDDAYDIYDEWLDEGNVMTDFLPVILDIYRASGIIKSDSEKNV